LLFWLWIFAIAIVWSLWLLLQEIYNYILVPFFNWFVNVALPWLITVLVVVISSIIALILWLSTGCQADYTDIYNSTFTMVNNLFTFLKNTSITIIQNIPELLAYLLIYVWLLLFFYLKEIYTKAKGYIKRSEQLKASREAYEYPVIEGKKLIQTLKDLFGRWT
jgi:hypothetical protein